MVFYLPVKQSIKNNYIEVLPNEFLLLNSTPMPINFIDSSSSINTPSYIY